MTTKSNTIKVGELVVAARQIDELKKELIETKKYCLNSKNNFLSSDILSELDKAGAYLNVAISKIEKLELEVKTD